MEKKVIFDHEKTGLGESFGLTPDQVRKVKRFVSEAASNPERTKHSHTIEDIVNHFNNLQELALALYIFGRYTAQVECPLHDVVTAFKEMGGYA